MGAPGAVQSSFMEQLATPGDAHMMGVYQGEGQYRAYSPSQSHHPQGHMGLSQGHAVGSPQDTPTVLAKYDRINNDSPLQAAPHDINQHNQAAQHVVNQVHHASMTDRYSYMKESDNQMSQMPFSMGHSTEYTQVPVTSEGLSTMSTESIDTDGQMLRGGMISMVTN